MADFLLELLSEEIPARMQARAETDLARLFGEELGNRGIELLRLRTFSTPRRIALIARDLPEGSRAATEERRGPRIDAPEAAIEGFCRATGLSKAQLEERDTPKGRFFYAWIGTEGRPTKEILAEAIPAIIRAFPWPKSMRWGEASVSTESPRWVRPLQGIVALLGEEIVEFEIAGVRSGAATVGHRFHHPGIITIGSANDYAEKLRACHVILDPAERRRIIAQGAASAAAAAGLTLVEDEGLVAENAGLTEWPVPLLGRFDPAFLEVPREVIQLTMRTNQKYFACTYPPRNGEGDQPKAGGRGSEPGTTQHSSWGGLAPNFICTANIDAADGGAAIVAGNQKVLAARLSDAKFFWEQDLKIPLQDQAKKLDQIVFHEKLGTVAEKVERVAKLARWLIEEGIVTGTVAPAKAGASGREEAAASPSEMPASAGMTLANLAETAARLCKADLVTGMVGEFPELQGIIGGYLARAQGHPDAVADAIRDHYKPVGQGDEVPSAPLTVAVSLADKLDSLLSFFAIGEKPTGSKDPFALRRSALGILSLIVGNGLRARISHIFTPWFSDHAAGSMAGAAQEENIFRDLLRARLGDAAAGAALEQQRRSLAQPFGDFAMREIERIHGVERDLLEFLADRLKVQQREAGVRHDLIDAVFALGGEDDLVRLLARVDALQAFVETPEGKDLLAGYKRAANILKRENWTGPSSDRHPGLDPGSTFSSAGDEQGRGMPDQARHDAGEIPLSYTPENEEARLIEALDSAEPRARAAVEAEDFEGAMAALASLRAPVDAFFDKVTVNDPDPAKREARLALLARMRDAVHRVADFARIEG
jgi:glycyl-tRNA synthetase beta chain